MPRQCAVVNCDAGRYDMLNWKMEPCEIHAGMKHDLCLCEYPFKLFPFPSEKSTRNWDRNPQHRTVWIQLINAMDRKTGEDWQPKIAASVCSKHFEDGEPTPRNPFPTLNMNLPATSNHAKLMNVIKYPINWANIQVITSASDTTEQPTTSHTSHNDHITNPDITVTHPFQSQAPHSVFTDTQISNDDSMKTKPLEPIRDLDYTIIKQETHTEKSNTDDLKTTETEFQDSVTDPNQAIIKQEHVAFSEQQLAQVDNMNKNGEIADVKIKHGLSMYKHANSGENVAIPEQPRIMSLVIHKQVSDSVSRNYLDSTTESIHFPDTKYSYIDSDKVRYVGIDSRPTNSLLNKHGPKTLFDTGNKTLIIDKMENTTHHPQEKQHKVSVILVKNDPTKFPEKPCNSDTQSRCNKSTKERHMSSSLTGHIVSKTAFSHCTTQSFRSSNVGRSTKKSHSVRRCSRVRVHRDVSEDWKPHANLAAGVAPRPDRSRVAVSQMSERPKENTRLEREFDSEETGCQTPTEWNEMEGHPMATTDHAMATTDHAMATTDHAMATTDHAMATTDHAMATTETIHKRSVFDSNCSTDTKVFKCLKVGCDKFFSKENYWKLIKLHMKSDHPGEHIFQCTVCDYGSALYAEYHDHLREHGQKLAEFKCAYCSNTYKYEHQLKRHSIVHSTDRPFKCLETGCNFATKHKISLERHTRETHSKEPSFLCNVCGFSSSRKHTLITHMKKHTDIRPYKCPFCKYTAREKYNYRKHMATQHP